MQERRLKSSRRRSPETAADLVAAMTSPGRRAPRRLAPELLAGITGAIEEVVATAGPVVEATADAARGDDPARQHERLAVALRNLETAMDQATLAVRAALDDVERAKRRLPPRHK
jgi:outer membrane murein-binding lipoprotein Lpp